MTLRVIPEFNVFQAILRKEASFTGVVECREAYNILVELNVRYGLKILLPKLIEDKIKGIITPSQEPHFYSLLDKDTSSSGEAGYTYENCLSRTAKTNSFKSRVLILTDKPLQKPELIEGNKKVVVMAPHKFITLYRVMEKAYSTLRFDGKFMDFLILMIFFNVETMDGVYSLICKGANPEDVELRKDESSSEEEHQG